MKVTAAIIEKDGRILLARRKREKKGGGCLEFPGGKVRPGEEPPEGLRRELLEEFGLQAEIKESLGIFQDPKAQPGIELWVYRVALKSPPLYLVDHEEIVWVSPEEIPLAELLPLDRQIALFLRSLK